MIESSNQERSSLIHLGAKPACLKWLIGMSPNEAEGEGAPPLKAGPLPETGGGQREGLLSQAWSVEALPAGAAVLSEIHGGEAPKRAGRGDEGGGAPPSKGQGWGAEAAEGGPFLCILFLGVATAWDALLAPEDPPPLQQSPEGHPQLPSRPHFCSC